MSWHDNLEEPADGKSWVGDCVRWGRERQAGSENSQAVSLQGKPQVLCCGLETGLH